MPLCVLSGTLRRGRRIGVDVGSVRVGVAVSDPDGLLAFPLTTLTADEHVIQQLHELADEHEAVEVIVGLPRHLSGAEGSSADAARAVATALLERGISVRLIDERLSTTTAQAQLRAQGRKAREQRAVIDAEAARIILQFALDSERASGRLPGEAP
jgi:putative Holliday junction resolvase